MRAISWQRSNLPQDWRYLVATCRNDDFRDAHLCSPGILVAQLVAAARRRAKVNVSSRPAKFLQRSDVCVQTFVITAYLNGLPFPDDLETKHRASRRKLGLAHCV